MEIRAQRIRRLEAWLKEHEQGLTEIKVKLEDLDELRECMTRVSCQMIELMGWEQEERSGQRNQMEFAEEQRNIRNSAEEQGQN